MIAIAGIGALGFEIRGIEIPRFLDSASLTAVAASVWSKDHVIAAKWMPSLTRDFMGGVKASSSRGAALLHRIAHVIRLSTEKKVGRVNAGWVVAMVTDKLSFWNWTIGQVPDGSMSGYLPRAFAIGPKLSRTEGSLPVSELKTRSCPQPASIGTSRLIDMRPKQFEGGFHNGGHYIGSPFVEQVVGA